MVSAIIHMNQRKVHFRSLEMLKTGLLKTLENVIENSIGYVGESGWMGQQKFIYVPQT